MTSAQAWEVVVETEPEWDEESRTLAIALDEVDLCTVCGGPAYLCQDPEREFDWEADSLRCHRTAALITAQAAVTQDDDSQKQALVWRSGLRRTVASGDQNLEGDD